MKYSCGVPRELGESRLSILQVPAKADIDGQIVLESLPRSRSNMGPVYGAILCHYSMHTPPMSNSECDLEMSQNTITLSRTRRFPPLSLPSC